MKRIPIKAAKLIAEEYGYDQVIIVARAVGTGEHVTTYGVDKVNCRVAGLIGEFLTTKIMGWRKDNVKTVLGFPGDPDLELKSYMLIRLPHTNAETY